MWDKTDFIEISYSVFPLPLTFLLSFSLSLSWHISSSFISSFHPHPLFSPHWPFLNLTICNTPLHVLVRFSLSPGSSVSHLYPISPSDYGTSYSNSPSDYVTSYSNSPSDYVTSTLFLPPIMSPLTLFLPLIMSIVTSYSISPSVCGERAYLTGYSRDQIIEWVIWCWGYISP